MCRGLSLLFFWTALTSAFSAFAATGTWNGCALAIERVVMTTDNSTHNIVLSPQVPEIGNPWVPRAKFQSDRGRMVLETLDNDIMRIEWSGDQGLPPDGSP